MTNHVFYYLDPATIEEYIEQEQFQKCIRLYRQGIYSREELKNSLRTFLWNTGKPELFKQIPFFGARPEKTYTHGYHNSRSTVTRFECMDDGGLSSDQNPIGKTYILKDKYGLKAALTITEVSQVNQVSIFLAQGSIEGYTAEASGTKTVNVMRTNTEGLVYELGYMETDEDLEVFRTFPLWQEYFLTMATAKEREAAVLDEIINRIIA